MRSRRFPYLALVPLVLGAILACFLGWFDVWTIGALFSGGLAGELFVLSVIPNLGASFVAVFMILQSWRMMRSLESGPRALAFFGIGGCSALAFGDILIARNLLIGDYRVGDLMFATGAFGAIAILLQTRRQVIRPTGPAAPDG